MIFVNVLLLSVLCPRTLAEDKVDIGRKPRLALLDNINKEYHISFDFFQERVTERVTSLLRFLPAKAGAKDAIEMPVILNVVGKHMLYICRKKYVKSRRCFSRNHAFHLRTWINVKVSQTMFGEEYFYKIIVNGNQLFSSEIKNPQAFRNVNVYGGGHKYSSVNGFIRNLNLNGK